jgi:ribonuclease BN (tRNA processing enzyme)
MLLGTGGWVPTGFRETACVYLRDGDRVLLLDAGTGARHLLTSPDLVRGVARIDVCLSHFHLDHVIGLSYLPGFRAGAEVVVWGPGAALYETPTADVLSRLIGPPFFPVNLGEFASVEELHPGQPAIDTFRLTVRHQERHTQPSVAFRVRDDITYCTDTGYDPGNVSFAAGCRHLLHEAFYLDEAPDETHTTPAGAARVARDADVASLTLMHVDPRLGDEARLLDLATAIFPRAQVGRDLTTLD